MPVWPSTHHLVKSKRIIETSKIGKNNHWSIVGVFYTNKIYFLIWKLNFFAIFYCILMHFIIVFDLTQFWLDGQPGNEYFWIPYNISGLLTPLIRMGVLWNRLLKVVISSLKDFSNFSLQLFRYPHPRFWHFFPICKQTLM